MYHPLDHRRSEIRLLTILPDPVDSHIRVRLEIYTLATNEHLAQAKRWDTISGWEPAPIRFKTPYYEALSYEWADVVGPKHRILLDGEPFYVRKNLFQALLCLRATGVTTHLLVDAICIDQAAVQERNHQVR
jgi:hypothetical protein